MTRKLTLIGDFFNNWCYLYTWVRISAKISKLLTPQSSHERKKPSWQIKKLYVAFFVIFVSKTEKKRSTQRKNGGRKKLVSITGNRSIFHKYHTGNFLIYSFAETVFSIFFRMNPELRMRIWEPAFFAVLRIRIRDPMSFWPLDPGSGIGFFRIPDPKPIFLRA